MKLISFIEICPGFCQLWKCSICRIILTSKNGSGAQCVCGSVSYEKCMMHHEEENQTTRLTVEQLKSCNQQEWTKTLLAKNKIWNNNNSFLFDTE